MSSPSRLTNLALNLLCCGIAVVKAQDPNNPNNIPPGIPVVVATSVPTRTVVRNTVTSVAPIPEKSTSNTGLLVGIIISGVLVFTLALGVIIWNLKRKAQGGKKRVWFQLRDKGTKLTKKPNKRLQRFQSQNFGAVEKGKSAVLPSEPDTCNLSDISEESNVRYKPDAGGSNHSGLCEPYTFVQCSSYASNINSNRKSAIKWQGSPMPEVTGGTVFV